jgi:hypothetical protein
LAVGCGVKKVLLLLMMLMTATAAAVGWQHCLCGCAVQGCEQQQRLQLWEKPAAGALRREPQLHPCCFCCCHCYYYCCCCCCYC